MKGFIAVAMSLIPQLKALHLQFPVHFAFSYDEEIGCRGAPSLIERMVKLNYKPKACIVGEPTSMQPVIGHKGIQCYRCQIHGVAAHSSLTPQGCNAIDMLHHLLAISATLPANSKPKGIGTRPMMYLIQRCPPTLFTGEMLIIQYPLCVSLFLK